MLDEFIKPIVTDREPHLLRLTGIGIEVAGKLRPAAPKKLALNADGVSSPNSPSPSEHRTTRRGPCRGPRTQQRAVSNPMPIPHQAW